MSRSLKRSILAAVCVLVACVGLSIREASASRAIAQTQQAIASKAPQSLRHQHRNQADQFAAVRPAAWEATRDSESQIDLAPILRNLSSVKHVIAPRLKPLPPPVKLRSKRAANKAPQQEPLSFALIGYPPIPEGSLPTGSGPDDGRSCSDRTKGRDRRIDNNNNDCAVPRPVEIAQVPEPSTWAMFGAGLALLCQRANYQQARKKLAHLNGSSDSGD
jgi:hypothetical protein